MADFQSITLSGEVTSQPRAKKFTGKEGWMFRLECKIANQTINYIVVYVGEEAKEPLDFFKGDKIILLNAVHFKTGKDKTEDGLLVSFPDYGGRIRPTRPRCNLGEETEAM